MIGTSKSELHLSPLPGLSADEEPADFKVSLKGWCAASHMAGPSGHRKRVRIMALDRGPSPSSKSLLVCLNRQVFGLMVVAFNGDKVAARLDNALSYVEIAELPRYKMRSRRTLCEIAIFLDAMQQQCSVLEPQSSSKLCRDTGIGKLTRIEDYPSYRHQAARYLLR
jgi:hypothetical protein